MPACLKTVTASIAASTVSKTARPAVTNSGIPWVYIFSAGPLLVLYDPEKMPPPASG